MVNQPNKPMLAMLLFGSSMFIAPQALAQSAQPTAPPAANDEQTVAELVVTASKREEKLRDVPSAVTTLSADAIKAQGVRDFRDYAPLVPGLSQRSLGAPGIGTVILRGLNTGPQQTTNTTAFYVDEATYTPSGFSSVASFSTPSPDLVDVERMEVMKGPQGTLYGASSLGGLIRVVTKRPDLTQYSGMAQVEGVAIAHGAEGSSVRGAVNIPLVQDKLAIRASAYYRDAPGWIDNVQGGKDINGSLIRGARLALRAQPTDRFTFDASAFYQSIKNDGVASQLNVMDTARPALGEYKESFLPGSGSSEITYRTVAGTANYETDVGAIVATGSFVDSSATVHTDYSTTYGPLLLGVLTSPPFGLPLTNMQVLGTVAPATKKSTAELRFVSKRLGAIEFVAGGFYTSEKSVYGTLLETNDPTGAPLPKPLDIFLKNSLFSTYKEYAAFGNFTYYLTDDLDITGGVRWSHNDQTNFQPVGIAFFAPKSETHAEFSDSATTYLATIRYRPTSAISLYARAASGYRPGGPQNDSGGPLPPGAQTTIRPDTVWNYEAGMKGNFLDGRLSASLAAFRIDWKDIQLNSLFGGLLFQANAGRAKVDGVELEVAARPLRDLTIGFNGGYTNARISQIDPAAAISVGAAAGDPLPLTAKWTAAAFADQNIPLTGDVTGTVGATLRYRSEMPSSYPGAFLNPNVRLPEYATLDLRAGVNFSRYVVQLRVENVFDKLTYDTIVTNKVSPALPAPTTAYVGRPRTFVLSVTANF
ncbi:TonB-dependent receptor [Caulobacter soli]|uniref:TonB-dependent receptor n=1 Tax=Caulobacter soli TaxID=2708539 RepID=UPI0013EB7F26|nr:TonB-dependent receptor [Caulobacter soli]